MNLKFTIFASPPFFSLCSTSGFMLSLYDFGNPHRSVRLLGHNASYARCQNRTVQILDGYLSAYSKVRKDTASSVV